MSMTVTFKVLVAIVVVAAQYAAILAIAALLLSPLAGCTDRRHNDGWTQGEVDAVTELLKK